MDACALCGLAVANMDTHYEWHVEQASSSAALQKVLKAFGKVPTHYRYQQTILTPHRKSFLGHEPLQGATVVVEGGGLYTTDEDGRVEFTDPRSSVVLVIQKVGYKDIRMELEGLPVVA